MKTQADNTAEEKIQAANSMALKFLHSVFHRQAFDFWQELDCGLEIVGSWLEEHAIVEAASRPGCSVALTTPNMMSALHLAKFRDIGDPSEETFNNFKEWSFDCTHMVSTIQASLPFLASKDADVKVDDQRLNKLALSLQRLQEGKYRTTIEKHIPTDHSSGPIKKIRGEITRRLSRVVESLSTFATAASMVNISTSFSKILTTQDAIGDGFDLSQPWEVIDEVALVDASTKADVVWSLAACGFQVAGVER